MILFSDFDKTLYFRGDDEKTKDNFDAISEWKEKGNQFCVVTGRSYRSITEHMPVMKDLCDYFIVDSGSIITSKSGEIIKAFFFGESIVGGIVKLSKSFAETPIAYYYSPGYEGVDAISENITKLRLWFRDINLLEGAAKQIREIFPVFAFCSDPILQNKEELAGYIGFIEIIPVELGKGNAIRHLTNNLNIPIPDIITVGDGLNDYEMVDNFNGYAIDGSNLSTRFKKLKTTSSVSSLIKKLNS